MLQRASSDSATRSGTQTYSYIDEWQATTVRPALFYDSQAAPGLKQKNYFYAVDLQGRLFLEEVLPKNIATSLKSEKFLDFFFRRIKRTGKRERSILQKIGSEWNFNTLADDYPFVSPCGVELNFIRPADTVIVFHSIREAPSGGRELVFGATLTHPFSPGRLFISKRTGRIYHEMTVDLDEEKIVRDFGLIKSSLAVSLSDGIVDGGETTSGEKVASSLQQHSGMDFVCPDTGNTYPIAWLPDEAEPGSWALPHDESEDIP